MAQQQPKFVEVLESSMGKAQAKLIDAMDKIASHYLQIKRYHEAATLYERFVTMHTTTSGPAVAMCDMYNLVIARNQQKKFGESIPILEQVVPMLVWRQRMDEDPQQHFAQQEIGAMREYVVAPEGVGRIDDAKVVVGKALIIVEGLGEWKREVKVANLRAASGLFEMIRS
jgi:hypothetical protein